MSRNASLSLHLTQIAKSNVRLSGFAGHRVPVIGRCRLMVSLPGGSAVTTTFYIIDSNQTTTMLECQRSDL